MGVWDGPRGVALSNSKSLGLSDGGTMFYHMRPSLWENNDFLKQKMIEGTFFGRYFW